MTGILDPKTALSRHIPQCRRSFSFYFLSSFSDDHGHVNFQSPPGACLAARSLFCCGTQQVRRSMMQSPERTTRSDALGELRKFGAVNDCSMDPIHFSTSQKGCDYKYQRVWVLICVQGIPLPCVSSCHSKISWWRQGAGACILAFSTTDRDSFDAVESWYKKVPCPWTSIAFLCWMAPNGAFGWDLHWLVIAMLVFAQVHDECGQMAMVLVQNKAGMDFSRLTWQWMILSSVKASAC